LLQQLGEQPFRNATRRDLRDRVWIATAAAREVRCWQTAAQVRSRKDYRAMYYDWSANTLIATLERHVEVQLPFREEHQANHGIGFNKLHTGYVDEVTDELVTSKRKIARNYLKAWFILDVAGSIPWSFIVMMGLFGGGGTESLQVVKILKVPKLLRLARLFKMLSQIEGAANVGRIVLFMLLLALLIHWLAASDAGEARH